MKHLSTLTIIILFLSLTSALLSQNEVELRSDGIVVPKTTPIQVTNPVKGMLIYDTDIDAFRYYNGSNWLMIGGGGNGGTVNWSDITGIPAGFADNIDNAEDGDTNASNEIQDLELLSSGKLTLTNSSAFVLIRDISPWTIDGTNAEKEVGKVGIGQPIPEARLDIVSDANEDGLRVRIDGQTKLRVRSNGGVNIGGNPASIPTNGLRVYGKTSLGTTSMPTEQLEVTGAINLSGNASSNNPAAGTIRWNSNTVDFEGYDGTHWESLTGLAGPQPPPAYQIGQYVDEGVVFWISPDGKTVKFVHFERPLMGSFWSRPNNTFVAGAMSNVDGYQNTLAIVSDPDISSSAAKECYNLNAGGHDDWYLPAIHELEALHDNLVVVNQSIEDNLGDPLSEDEYWSSTQLGDPFVFDAYKWDFETGEQVIREKRLYRGPFRAIRTLTLP